jgi:hypothetical protein
MPRLALALIVSLAAAAWTPQAAHAQRPLTERETGTAGRITWEIGGAFGGAMMGLLSVGLARGVADGCEGQRCIGYALEGGPNLIGAALLFHPSLGFSAAGLILCGAVGLRRVLLKGASPQAPEPVERKV